MGALLKSNTATMSLPSARRTTTFPMTPLTVVIMPPPLIGALAMISMSPGFNRG
jgi:hypothetical protein